MSRYWFFLVLFWFSAVHLYSDALRILCLGDSITQADHETYSWRYEFWKRAMEGGREIDMVGPFTENYNGNPEWPNVKGKAFDQNHASQWGWTANKVADHLPKWLEQVDADVAIIHLGTNDLLLGQGTASTLKDLEKLVQILREDNPKIRILLAQIMPSASSRDFRGFNQALGKSAVKWSTPASPVEVVDCFTGFDLQNWTYDGLHPFGHGEAFLARRFYEAVWKPKTKAVEASEPKEAGSVSDRPRE